ncbi:hypothetical protein SASPL_106882 [Salvia splendens]|uniref:HTH myb-type domain-containing protein n=1 Tax=Salvia splendens TaxID=180675 RepID=A0A8X8YAD1_SALSN|nr:hypothetical protein SASPL_106882 [Salvia splendens]
MSSVEDTTSSATWAIENGALLYIERPTSLDMLRYLWQLVATETMRVLRDVEDPNDVDNSRINKEKVKRKMCTEWTKELHEKFVDAVEQLGDGSKILSPNEILEKMNVPGLTRMQVASHLQVSFPTTYNILQ